MEELKRIIHELEEYLGPRTLEVALKELDGIRRQFAVARELFIEAKTVEKRVRHNVAKELYARTSQRQRASPAKKRQVELTRGELEAAEAAAGAVFDNRMELAAK